MNLGITIKIKNGSIIVESKKYNDNLDYQKPIKNE
jgi:hypothetical protein